LTIHNSQFTILCKQSGARKHERYFKQQKTRKTRKIYFWTRIALICTEKDIINNWKISLNT